MTIIENDIYTLKKLNTIVKDKLPKFASRYFDDNIDTKTPGTLLGYARDLNYFFEYLKSISYTYIGEKKMY